MTAQATKRLSLHNQGLTAFPDEVVRIQGLTDLSLGASRLHVLPPALQLLTSLTVLRLQDNALLALPYEVVPPTMCPPRPLSWDRCSHNARCRGMLLFSQGREGEGV